MKYETQFLSRGKDGAKDLFQFRVSYELLNQIVEVRIPIEFNATLESKRLSQDELIEVTKLWLDSHLSNGKCDPFARPETDTRINLPLLVLDSWKDRVSVEAWLQQVQ